MKPKLQLLFIALVIILILVGEAIVYIPQLSSSASVVIKSYPSTTALVEALSNGEIDVAPLENVAPQTLLQLKNDPNLNIIPIENFGFTYVGLNLRNSPLNNSVFREAMLYGFNRERILSNALAGYGETLSPGLFSSAYAALGWRNESIDSYPYDPPKASELLDGIGFNLTSTGVRIDPATGQKLRTMFIYSRLTDPQAVAAANMFAQDMQAIGLPIVSFPETDFDFHSQTVPYAFDLYIETESANAAPTWLYGLFAGINNLYPAPLSTNLVGYNNSTFNKYAAQLMTASNPSGAREAAMKCQEELSLDLPAIPVYSKNLLLVEQKGALNITPITGSIPETLAASLANMTAGSLVRIGEVGGLTDINPAITLTDADSLALRLLTTPFLTYNPDGSARPGLIDRWQTSDNATTLTLQLNQSSKFQDGNPTTAHDVAATLNWLITNTLPSTPLYPVLKTIRDVAEDGANMVSISLTRSDYFAAYEFGNLFALPAMSLPQVNGPLALLLSGALQSTGQFELARFVQGAEADLQSTPLAGSAHVPAVSGVLGQNVFGSVVGGCQIQIRSEQLEYGGQAIENATFTVLIHYGNSTPEISGIHIWNGLYQATLNLNNENLSPGSYVVTTQLYAQLPTAVILQFNEQNLTVHPPQFLGQIILYLLAVAGVAIVAYNTTRKKARKGARKRVRRARRTTVRRPRKRR